jgi:hypothetical protein
MAISQTSIDKPLAGPNDHGARSASIERGEIVIQCVAKVCLSRFGGGLRALILTGSLARGEGSLEAKTKTGEAAGDAEFILILQDGAAEPASAQVGVLAAEMERECAQAGINCKVGLAIGHADLLRQMRPHIFAYETKVRGRVVLGEETILGLIPDFTPSDIPIDDAWRLLSNRMIELLEAFSVEGFLRQESVGRAIQYRTIKLQLDMATSLLLFLGRYAPSYTERCENLRSLAKESNSENDLPFSLRELADAVDDSTNWKLNHGGSVDGRAEWSWVLRTCRCAYQLWDWELQRMTGKRDGASTEKCLLAMKKQPEAARFRGWLVVIRECGLPLAQRPWRRWFRLSRSASPRYWTYAVAGELFSRMDFLFAAEQMGEADDFEAATLASRLPMAALDGGAGSQSWVALMRTVAWNYHQFLEKTRA